MTKAELWVDNQRLQAELREYKSACNSKSELLVRVLNDLDKETKENCILRTEDGKYAVECGKLEVELQILKYRLELAKIAYYEVTGEYDPEWPVMSHNDLYSAFSDILPSIPEKANKGNSANDDILNLFKQSSKGI